MDEASLIHYIRCNRCKEILTEFPNYISKVFTYCKECAEHYKTTQNKMVSYEKLAKHMHYPCVYKSYGCKELLDLKRRDKHTLYCKYRQFPCMFPCNFQDNFNGIVLHYKNEHEHSNLEDFKIKFGHNIQIFHTSTDLFLLDTIFQQDELQYTLKYIGYRDKKFTCRIWCCKTWTKHFNVDYYHNNNTYRNVKDIPAQVLMCKMEIVEDMVRSFVQIQCPIEKFSCPVCLDVLVPPIWQCKNGHGICEKCIFTPHCPICRYKTKQSRNLQLEKLIKGIGFERSCVYLNCHHVTNIINLQEHELKCNYRHFICPLCKNWQGQFCDLPGHMQTDHAKMVLEPSQSLYVDSSKTYVMRHWNDYFKVELQVKRTDLHILVESISCVRNFFYTVDIVVKNKNYEKRFHVKKLCTNIEDPSDDKLIIIPVDWNLMNVKCDFNISDE